MISKKPMSSLWVSCIRYLYLVHHAGLREAHHAIGIEVVSQKFKDLVVDETRLEAQ